MLDPVIHAQARLRIMATLAALPQGDEMVFPRLRELLGMTTLLGGTCPFIATWLIAESGEQAAPAYYLTAIAALALGSLLVSHWAPPMDLSVIRRSTR